MAFVSGAWSRLLGDLQISEWLEAPSRAVIHAFRPPSPVIELCDDILHQNTYRLHHHPAVTLPSPFTWDEDPLGDRNWQMWHHSLLHVSYLVQAHRMGGSLAYLDRAAAIVESWIQSFIHEGREHPMAWHDHAIAQRTLVLLEFAESWRRSHAMDIPAARRLLGALYHHGALLTEPHVYRLRHNHGIEQDRALLELAILVPQWPESEAWRQLAWSRLLEQVRAAISLEGIFFEHSPNYEGAVCLMLSQTRDFLAAHGRPHDEITHAIESLAEKIAFSVRPDGTWPPIGDSVSDRSDELVEYLRRNPSHGEHALYALTGGSEGAAPTSTHLILPTDGCAIIRERWDREALCDSIHCYFTAAFNTRTHKHHDDLSFTLFAFGREILTDAGRHSYNYADPHRRYCESVFGHNVVIVDQADTDTRRLNIGKSGITSTFTGRNLVGVDAVHYLYRNVECRRLLLYFRPNVLVVFDRLNSSDEITATQQFLFSPEWRVEAFGDSCEIRATPIDSSGPTPLVRMFQLQADAGAPCVIRGRSDPLIGWVSRRHGEFEPTDAVHSRSRGAAPAFVTAFVLDPDERNAKSVSGQSNWNGHELVCNLSIGEQTVEFRYLHDAARASLVHADGVYRSRVWPTPFEYRTRRSLAIPRGGMTAAAPVGAEREALMSGSGAGPKLAEQLNVIASQVEQVEAGQRQTVESLHRQLHQMQSGLRTIQNKLNGSSFLRIEKLEAVNNDLGKQVRYLSRQIARSERQNRALRLKVDRLNYSTASLRALAASRRTEAASLKAAMKKLRESSEDFRQKLERAKEQHRVERGRFLHSQAQLHDLLGSVRWRIGHAFILALRPSLDTIKLPFRLIGLLFDGLKRRAERKRLGHSPMTMPSIALESKAPSPAEKSTPAPHVVSDIVEVSRRMAPQPRRDVRVACVLDEFSHECFAPEADWKQILPQDWQRQIEEFQPEILFVESAWKGIGEQWRHLVSTDRRERDGPLKSLVDHCRAKNIPTVFWNKEDPANYQHFIGSAIWFDYILTTDSDCIERYAKAAGHRRIGVLPFAAQPRIHNPIARRGGDLGNVCFAGTWYANKHDGRADDARLVLQPAIEFGLHIYDRMHGYDGPGWQNYLYPPEYQDCIRGGLPYEQMLDAYKRYHVFLNVNSVRNSPTMCSRRVFEILACGTNVVSAYAPSLEHLIGNDCVFLSRTAGQTRDYLRDLLTTHELRNRTSVRAIRRMMTDHTYAHRFAEVLTMLGMSGRVDAPTVAAIFPVTSESDMARGRAFIEAASYLNIEPTWIVTDSSLPASLPGRVVSASPESLSGAIAEEIASCCNDYLFIWQGDRPLAVDSLADLIHAFAYFGGQAVTKPTNVGADNLIYSLTQDAAFGRTLLRTSAAKRLPSSAFVNAEAFQAALRESEMSVLATDTVDDPIALVRPCSGIDSVSADDSNGSHLANAAANGNGDGMTGALVEESTVSEESTIKQPARTPSTPLTA
ncbi:MAG: heparinase II/III family protein [Phycisphaerae bacterium]|nr:heparinase II/III family protein [Phycisphaerae bacterium]